MVKNDLNPNEYNEHYGRYLNLLDKNTELINGLKNHKYDTISYFASIPPEKLNYRYLPEKWTIKEVFQHIIDTERVFIYRCFAIGRGDKTPLPNFNENEYIPTSKANEKNLGQLVDEFIATRDYTLSIIRNLTNENLKEIGMASNSNLSARACGFIILAHALWHIQIINERYL